MKFISAALLLVSCLVALSVAVPNIPPYFEADFELTNNMIPFPMNGHFWFDYEELKQRMDTSMMGANRVQIDDFKEKLSHIITEGFGQSSCKTCFLDQSVYPMTVPEVCVKAGEETINGVDCEVWKGFWAATDMAFWVAKASTPYIARAYFNFMSGSMIVQWDFTNVAPQKPEAGVWQPNCTCSQPVCKSPLDLVLLLDGSGSIAPNDFQLMKTFASKVVSQFELSESDGARVSMVQFASASRVEVALSGDKNAVTTTINNMKQMGGGTNMDGGLRTSQSVLTKGRADATKAIILFTDGQPDAGTNPVAVAQDLKNQNIALYTVGIGKGVDPNILKKIASEPAETHAFLADSFVKLQSLLNSLVQATCKADTCASS